MIAPSGGSLHPPLRLTGGDLHPEKKRRQRQEGRIQRGISEFGQSQTQGKEEKVKEKQRKRQENKE